MHIKEIYHDFHNNGLNSIDGLQWFPESKDMVAQ